MNFVDENDEVLISGFGRRGKAKGDIPGVRFKVVKVSGVGLLALWKEKKVSRPLPLYRTSTEGLSTIRRSPDHDIAVYQPLTCTFRYHPKLANCLILMLEDEL